MAAYAADARFSSTTACTRHWHLVHGLWLDATARVVVPDDAALRADIVRAHHEPPTAAHQGVARTYKAIQARYWWRGLKRDVQRFVSHCHSCQVNKPSNRLPGGLLQPLPAPERPWADMSVDLITALPPCGPQRFDAVCVFVDRLTKMVHYTACHETLTALQFADLFVQNVFRLHGCPLRIVSDRGSIFTAAFWREVAAALGPTQLLFSTAYHPQTDGQTERANRVLEEMLRHYVSPMTGDWVRCLPLLEFACNSAHNDATGMSPFRLYTGLQPLCPQSTLPERAFKVPAAREFVESQAAEFQRAKQCLRDAQSRMKQGADKRRRDVAFRVGDRVLLNTRNLVLRTTDPRKLWPRFIGPLRVTQRIGAVAYRLDLPDTMHIHNVFHVSLLHPYRDNGEYHPPPPRLIEGELEYEVASIRAHKVRRVGARHEVQFLVQWEGYGKEHDTWEPGALVDDCEQLDVYLRQLQQDGYPLPPGYRPTRA